MHPSSFGCDSRRRPPDRDPEERQRLLELVPGGHLNAPPLPSVDPDRLTCGVRVLTVFPSPPLPKASSDQRRSAELGERRPRQTPNPSPYDRVHHTRLSVFASPGAGQVFRPHRRRTVQVFGRRPLEGEKETAWSAPVVRPTARKPHHAGGSAPATRRSLKLASAAFGPHTARYRAKANPGEPSTGKDSARKHDLPVILNEEDRKSVV